MTAAAREAQRIMLRIKYDSLAPLLNERTRRTWAATEARAIGHGGIIIVAATMEIHPDTIRAGMIECASPASTAPHARIRKTGGGRKTITTAQPKLSAALDALLETGTRGDPETPMRWTTRSLRTLRALLAAKGYAVSWRKLGAILHADGYSLQSNRKTEEGSDHPDHDLQFRHISDRSRLFIRRKQPVISVDTKKKELIGNFKDGHAKRNHVLLG